MILDGDGKITADGDRTYIGDAIPDMFGGFGTTLYWKGLMCNLTFTYSIGGQRYWSDDAVSLYMDGDNYVLGVHIADVSNYLQ